MQVYVMYVCMQIVCMFAGAHVIFSAQMRISALFPVLQKFSIQIQQFRFVNNCAAFKTTFIELKLLCR